MLIVKMSKSDGNRRLDKTTIDVEPVSFYALSIAGTVFFLFHQLAKTFQSESFHPKGEID